MERISLPTRTLSKRTIVVVAVTVPVILVMLGWIAMILCTTVAWDYYMKDFRRIVITGMPISKIVAGDELSRKTLFESGGIKHALKPYAEKAQKLDTWNAEMHYLFARALWREYKKPADPSGLTSGEYRRDDLPQTVVFFLRQAIRRDPTNCFYRATLADVLNRLERTPEINAEIDGKLLPFYAPQNAYGQIRTAEMLRKRGADKERVARHYCRALGLVSAEITSGLLYVDGAGGSRSLRPMGQALVSRALDGLLGDCGDYKSWAAGVPDYPETRWLLGNALSGRGMRTEAGEERTKLVTSVKDRLAVQENISTARLALEMFCPLSRPDYRGRFLKGREIGYAGGILDRMKRSDEAIELFRFHVKRSPRYAPARLRLGKSLLERAPELKTEAAGFSAQAAALRMEAQNLVGGPQVEKLKELQTRAKQLEDRAREVAKLSEDMYQEVEDNVNVVLRLNPAKRLKDDALSQQRRLPKKTEGP